MAFSFFGGIHPKENKWYAENHPIQVFLNPTFLWYLWPSTSARLVCPWSKKVIQ